MDGYVSLTPGGINGLWIFYGNGLGKKNMECYTDVAVILVFSKLDAF